MWTPAARTQLARDDLPYATCLTDAEWAVVAPFMPKPAKVGRPWARPLRLVFDGVLYVLRTGCAWAPCRTSSRRTGRCIAGSCACPAQARSRP